MLHQQFSITKQRTFFCSSVGTQRKKGALFFGFRFASWLAHKITYLKKLKRVIDEKIIILGFFFLLFIRCLHHYQYNLLFVLQPG